MFGYEYTICKFDISDYCDELLYIRRLDEAGIYEISLCYSDLEYPCYFLLLNRHGYRKILIDIEGENENECHDKIREKKDEILEKIREKEEQEYLDSLYNDITGA